MATTTGARRSGSGERPRDTFGDVVLLASVVLFVLLAVGVGLLALQGSLY